MTEITTRGVHGHKRKTKPAKTGEEQAGNRGQFKPGISGNPQGRPEGSRNKATLAVQALLDGEAESLTRKIVKLAKGGDLGALKFCLSRVISPHKILENSEEPLYPLSRPYTHPSTPPIVRIAPCFQANQGKFFPGEYYEVEGRRTD